MWKIGGFRVVTAEESTHCPSCNSSRLRRTHRIGVLEKTLSKISSLRPYRCKECDERFFRVGQHREQREARPSETPHASKG
jgi:hypothetical protein